MTSIEWTDRVWNPLVGCSRVSKGCEHCYAERVAHRGMSEHHRGLTVLGAHGPRWTGEVRLVPEALSKPLSWRKPARVFVNSMSDLFHEKVAFETIAAIFGVMAACPQHTFQVLTKRPERAAAWFDWYEGTSGAGASPYAALCCAREALANAGQKHVRDLLASATEKWPLPNVWLGVSVEDQATADARIPVLLELPAAVRWVSYEPALGPVDFKGWGDHAPASSSEATPTWDGHVWEEWIPISQRELIENFWSASYGRGPASWLNDHVVQRVPRTGARLTLGRRGTSSWLDADKMAAAGVTGRYVHMWNNIGRLITDDGEVHSCAGGHGSGWFSKWLRPDGDYAAKIGWVVVGGESGPGARPFDVAWARRVLRQCREANVPVFVKQLGAKPIITEDIREVLKLRCGHTIENRIARLRFEDRKGGDMTEWPEDLRVREWPEVAP